MPILTRNRPLDGKPCPEDVLLRLANEGSA